ncbi:MAG TPA: hypothetical protein ENG63_02335 [Candidatus Desulfofervidus auxilii]|uniref:Uncharacterized protein n=1 Tax=Desulfofervidus auxilii TaxID=1621989 RepID=A0A7C0Y233_DESA2|nr:hypothetical protein [Candidatus Desulfofervidus auxilii]
MNKIILILISLIFCVGCIFPISIKKSPEITLNIPKIDIEEPPKLYPIKWHGLMIDNNKFYCITPNYVDVLILNLEMLREYNQRCYEYLKLIKELQDENKDNN